LPGQGGCGGNGGSAVGWGATHTSDRKADGAVQEAGIEIGIGQRGGDATRNGPLAASGGAIYCYDGNQIVHEALFIMQMKNFKNEIMVLGSVILLAGCAKGNGISMMPYQDVHDGPHQFKLCHGFACSEKSLVQLEEKQWNKVAAVFKKPAKTPEKERELITKAVAILEVEATKAAKLSLDRGEAETFEADQAQMDCIDEAINTTHYLEFLDEAGLLRHHEAAPPIHRGFFVDGQWPHNSGAVKEKNSGEVYAIDSYYFDAGRPPAVVPLDVWLDEWRPANLSPRRRS
jgi:hypothetical protein